VLAGELIDNIGKTVENAAWYYADPYDAAKSIKDWVAFGMSASLLPLKIKTPKLINSDKSKVTVKVE
jgi:hypothetical protein